ncbi:Multidrug resistance-associated protein 4, partial [Linnemannia gamsii]
RIRTLSDVFSGIELVKLCAWEVAFQEKILMLRSIELKYIWHSSILSSINVAIYFFFQPVVAMFAFTTYWLQHRDAVDPVSLTPDKVFVSLTLFNILRTNMTSYFPQAIQAWAGVRVSVKRISDFLLLPEIRGIESDAGATDADDTLGQGGVKAYQDLPDILIDMKDASFSWAISTEEKNEILELSAKDRKEKEAKEKEARAKK